MAIGLAVAVGLLMLPMAALILSHLGSVVKEGEQEGQHDNVEVAHRVWKQKLWSCQTSVVKMLPLTAIKIVVTVWQIISQVCYTRMLA